MQEVDLLRKGPWVEEEDEQLAAAVAVLGDRRWDSLAKASGLRRSGKSCRLRWMNYLRPNLKHGNISEEEEKIIVELHEKWGNKWSRIARKLPGRTDNEIKNYWRSHLRKKPLLLEKESLSSATNPSSGSECWTGSPCSTNDDQRFSMRADHISRPPDDAMFETMSLTRSPYETRLSEWASSNETNFVYPEWSTSDDWNWITSSSTWDLSLWDGQ